MATPKSVENKQKLFETKDLVFVWRLLVKNLAILIVIPFLAYIIGYVYAYRLTSIHGAKVQLLLKSSDTYDYQDQIYKGLGAYGVYMDAQNQMRIIRSRDLIEEVVDRMNVSISYFFVTRVRKLEAFETLPFKAEVQIPNSALYEKPISVEVINKDSYQISFTLNEEEQVLKGNFNEPIESNDLIIVLKPNYTFKDENITAIKDHKYEMILHSRDYLVNKYRSRMEIENVEYTSILEVRVMDEISQRAKMFLDTLTAVYVDYSKKLQLEVNENTVLNIEKQIDTISKFIKSKELELLGFKDKNAILNLPKEEDDYFQKYVESTSRKRAMQQRVAALKTLRSYILNLNDENFLPPSFEVLESDSYITQTIKRVYELQLELKGKFASQLSDNENIKKK